MIHHDLIGFQTEIDAEDFARYVANTPTWNARSMKQLTRINGKYGEAPWTPIRYVNRAHSRPALVGLNRSTRTALVTPLRMG
jgi:trehalose-6-phosphate synthase